MPVKAKWKDLMHGRCLQACLILPHTCNGISYSYMPCEVYNINLFSTTRYFIEHCKLTFSEARQLGSSHQKRYIKIFLTNVTSCQRVKIKCHKTDFLQKPHWVSSSALFNNRSEEENDYNLSRQSKVTSVKARFTRNFKKCYKMAPNRCHLMATE